MRQTPRQTPLRTLVLAATCALLLALVAAPAATAVEPYLFTLSGMAGVGGSQDAEPGSGFGNFGYQLGFSFITETRTRVAVRLGEMELGDGGDFARLTDAGLSYLSVAGEYRFPEHYYDTWFSFGLGAYRLDGDPRVAGADDEETAIGLSIGLTGEFRLMRKMDLVVEASGHYVDFEDAQVYGNVLAGVAFHF